MISIFGDGLAGCLVCGFLFGLGVVFCCLVACLVCFPHGRDLLFLLNCVRIVCNLERPSELSWRARHGRKKNVIVGSLFVAVRALCFKEEETLHELGMDKKA